jgi:hypothetical protein
LWQSNHQHRTQHHQPRTTRPTSDSARRRGWRWRRERPHRCRGRRRRWCRGRCGGRGRRRE